MLIIFGILLCIAIGNVPSKDFKSLEEIISKFLTTKDVIEKEIAGYQVIARLLNVYTTAINNQANNSLSNYDELILKTLPNI